MHTKKWIRDFIGNSLDRMGMSAFYFFYTQAEKKTCSHIKFDGSVEKTEIILFLFFRPDLMIVWKGLTGMVPRALFSDLVLHSDGFRN